MKRKNTFGHIRKRRDGVYQIIYTINKQKHYDTIYGTQKDAENKLAEIRLKYDKSRDAIIGVTVNEFWCSICHETLARRVKATTLNGYESNYANLVRPRFGDMPLEDITYRAVQDEIMTLSYGASRKLKATLSVIFTEAMKHEVITNNIMRNRFSYPGRESIVAPQNEEVLTLEELNKVFELCKGEFWEAAFILAGFGGMRLSEACSFKAGEIVYKNGFAYCEIVRTVVSVKNEIQIRENIAKTTKSLRTVVIPEPYATRLIMLQRDAIEQGHTWLLDDGFSRPINPNNVSIQFKRWFSDKPLKGIPFKNLRNSYATIMHAQGVDLHMIAKMLGHSTSSITFKNYDRPDASIFESYACNIGQSRATLGNNEENSMKVIDFKQHIKRQSANN